MRQPIHDRGIRQDGIITITAGNLNKKDTQAGLAALIGRDPGEQSTRQSTRI